LVFISVCGVLQTKPANAFEVAAWERVKVIKANFALREIREEDEFWLLSLFFGFKKRKLRRKKYN